MRAFFGGREGRGNAHTHTRTHMHTRTYNYITNIRVKPHERSMLLWSMAMDREEGWSDLKGSILDVGLAGMKDLEFQNLVWSASKLQLSTPSLRRSWSA